MLHVRAEELGDYRIYSTDIVLIEVDSIHNIVELTDRVLEKKAFPFFALNRGSYSEVIYNKNGLNGSDLLITSMYNPTFVGEFILNPRTLDNKSYIILESKKLCDIYRILQKNEVHIRGLKYADLEKKIMRHPDVQLLKFTTDRVRGRGSNEAQIITSACIRKLRTLGLTRKYKERLEQELETYFQLGLLPMLYDVYVFKKSWKVPLLRGSANNSLVCWLLDISMIDPVKFDLPFERFINSKKIWARNIS